MWVEVEVAPPSSSSASTTSRPRHLKRSRTDPRSDTGVLKNTLVDSPSFYELSSLLSSFSSLEHFLVFQCVSRFSCDRWGVLMTPRTLQRPSAPFNCLPPMLDRLPPELLLAVLEEVDLFPSFWRCKTLFACCSVSRAISVVAQPILWRRIVWKKYGHTKSIVAGGAGGMLRTQTRELDVRGSYPEGRSKHRMITRSAPTLQELRELGESEVSAFNALPGECLTYPSSLSLHYSC